MMEIRSCLTARVGNVISHPFDDALNPGSASNKLRTDGCAVVGKIPLKLLECNAAADAAGHRRGLPR